MPVEINRFSAERYDAMPRLVVIGAGISGLSAAHAARWEAERRARALEIIVFERDRQAGGKARSLKEDGFLVEAGPTGYLDNEPLLDRLSESVGLAKRPANAAAARRFLVRGGRMREIHLNPLKFCMSGILSPLGMARVALEPFIAARSYDTQAEDESILSFAERRLGKELARRMIAPMVLGVFAGDAGELSAGAAFPRLVELEREHGSLIRAMIALKRSRRPSGGPAGPSGTLTSFDDGLQELPLALGRSQAIDLRCGCEVRSITARKASGYRLQVDDDEIDADAVVLASESWNSASLIAPLAPVAARELAAIPTPPVTVVALGFAPSMRDAAPTGFGVLIPRGEGFRILGCLWDSHLFPGREPEGHLLLRVMLGGAVDPQVADLDDDEVMQTVLEDLRRLMPRLGKPLYKQIIRWARAIPQYTLGHAARLRSIDEDLARHPGIHLAGNACRGIAFTKAATAGARSGKEAARRLLA